MLSLRKGSHLLYGLLVALIVILSFREFSAFLTPNLNSDHAIHILMAYDLELPDDLYFWGQNRLGSLLPILSHLVLTIAPIQPVIIVSIVGYALLLIGFFAFTSLFKNALLKLIFALIWFLPLQPFNELNVISQPYGPQIAAIGVAVALTNRFLTQSTSGFRRQILIAGITASLFISLWVSDFSALTILIFGIVVLISLYKQNAASNAKFFSLKRLGLTPVDLINLAIVSVIGMAFILYAKDNASGRSTSYATFNTWWEIQFILDKLLNSFINTITFKGNWFLGIHAILVIILIFYVSYLSLIKRREEPFTVSQWTYLFFANATIGMILLVCLYWVYRNGVNFRYFTIVYVSFWLAALFFAQGLNGTTAKRMSLFLLIIAIVSTLSMHSRVFAFDRGVLSKIQQLQPIQTLGKAGFIGDYWTSYILCTVNPAQLNCTPYDRKGFTPCLQDPETQEQVGRTRCRRCIRKVLNSESIYLIREKWLGAFPDQIQQFKTCLVKAGEPIKLSGYTVAPYRKRPE